jgi:tRNA nucleotidyltransferase (CCA-adding enzyme)
MDRAIAYDSIPDWVSGVCQQLQAAGHEAYLVGGCIRDLLLGRPVHDWDVATSAHPQQVVELFSRTIPTGIEHGTVAVMVQRDRLVEVTTYRGEGAYSDGRHPDSVTFVGSIEEDLQRRDLTVNAMALDPAQRRLVDPGGGEADLSRRLIRAVGDPAARFAEDGLRPLRAIRFAAVLEFEIDPPTLEAVKSSLGSFRRVSRERVRDELMKILAARQPSVGLTLMRRTGLLAEVLPELDRAAGLHQNRHHPDDVLTHSLRVCDAVQGDAELRLAALLHDVGKPATAAPHPERAGELTFHGHEQQGARLCQSICRRLRLSNAQRERVCHLVSQHSFPLEGYKPPGLRRFLRRVGPEHLEDLLRLKEADIRVKNDARRRLELLDTLRQQLRQVAAEKPPMRTSELAISGRDVMQRLGIAGGPRVGQVLRALLEQVTEEPALNQPETLLRMVDELGTPVEE